MKVKTNKWHSVKEQSLAVFARNAGFDLAMYRDYSEDVQDELRKRAVKEAMAEIEYACEDKGFDFSGVKKGVYVITLSNPLSIQYFHRKSKVIYIGRGAIKDRIKSHFENKLFDFMLTLNGADFDFHFAKPALAGTPDYFKHVEHLMLEYFMVQYGGLDNEVRRYPILNKYAGSDKSYRGGDDWWKQPLKACGTPPLWELKPTGDSIFSPLDG